MKDNLPIRKNIRLEQYDYSQVGYYFITICIENRENILSKIEKGNNNCSCILTNEGKVVDKYIKEIEKNYPNIELEEYIIMPNHIHIILIINKKCTNTISKIVFADVQCTPLHFLYNF